VLGEPDLGVVSDAEVAVVVTDDTTEFELRDRDGDSRSTGIGSGDELGEDSDAIFHDGNVVWVG